jgi:hypothetical protein
MVVLVIILLTIFRFGITKNKTRIKVSRILLKSNMWFSGLLGVAISLFIVGMSHSKINWEHFVFYVLGVSGFLLLTSYLALTSFSNKNIVAKIYIWGYCAFLIFLALPLFPFSTIFGIIIIFGQLAWYKVEREDNKN